MSPEMRSLPSGKSVTNFSVATNEYRGGEERTEYHSVVTWERLAEICGQYLGKGQLVSLEGRLQTRRWEDDRKQKHYRTEIVASSVEMLSGRRKKDYAAEAAAQALETQAEMMGLEPVDADDFDASAGEIQRGREDDRSDHRDQDAGDARRDDTESKNDRQAQSSDSKSPGIGLLEPLDECHRLVDQAARVGREAEQLGQLADEDHHGEAG